jgi:hypothetical protein
MPPPVDVGAFQEATARSSPATAVTAVGRPGASAGVTATAEEATDVPATVVAVTLTL